MKTKIIALAVALFLGGCSSTKLAPMDYAKDAPASEKLVKQKMQEDESWNQSPVVTEGKASLVLITPESIPAEIRNKRIASELEAGATVKDIVAVLGKLGVTIVIADQELAKKSFYLPRYNGTVGGLLSVITKASDVWFTWHDGAIVVEGTARIGVSIPQEANFGESLGKGLESLGVKGSSVTWQAGMAVMEVTPSQFRKVKTYLERYTANAAVIAIQMAIVNVSMNQNAKSGIDWQNLQLSAAGGGTTADLKAWQAYNSSSTTTAVTTPTTGTTGTVAPATMPSAAVTAVGLTNGALTAAIFNNRFTFNGLFNFLQTYGNAETVQNVMLKTVAGNKLELKSLKSVPYVTEVGLTNTGVNNSTTGSTKTGKAEDGLTVALTPTYDASANSVTIDMKVSVKAVVAMNELSAGNQIGKLTQPTTADNDFTDILRLRPGETMVVGGLSYYTYSDNKGAPIFLTSTPLESTSLTVNRQTMFIVIRPTVTRLGQVLGQESGDSLDILPSGSYAPEPSDKPKYKNPGIAK